MRNLAAWGWTAWGWTAREEEHWAAVPAEFIPARVVGRYPSQWRVAIPAPAQHPQHPQIELVELAGSFQYLAAGPEEYPVVGDWVALSPESSMIQHVLPRRTTISRQEAGRAARGQVLAANVDTALLVFGLDGGRNFSLGLLERFLTLVAAGGVRPVVVLNKSDCASQEHLESVTGQAASVCDYVNAPILVTSARSGAGIGELREMIPPGATACCLGRSGVGKSSIINALLGEEVLRTGAVSRIQNKGRHTTSAAQLLMLPGRAEANGAPGGMLIDTPGLRELQLWGGAESLLESFADIRETAAHCRFSDCRHEGEPGCAVQRAAAEGSLPQLRLEHYLEQRSELEEADLRHRLGSDGREKQKWKKISKDIRRYYRK